ncbi:MAG: ParB N-terminal domain-containing protein [Thermoplasmata archaeon]|nr:ParB N-terminal domain-containing protein [Thermoplasmata archaeon]
MSRAKPSGGRRSPIRFAVVELAKLRGHEETRPQLLAELTAKIKRDGYLKQPILVADRDFVILDGHHRVEAVRSLGCIRIPAYLVDYDSDVVNLGTWPDAVVSSVTKDEVIRRGGSNDRFPPKTTRHTVKMPLEDRPTDLESLR